MDIVIAAAGKGTRLQQYNKDIPKHIIEVAGKPFLYYLLDAIVAAQFHRIIIVGGHHYDKLLSAIREYKTDAEIITINQFDVIGNDSYGTACPVLAVEKLIQGDRFVYTMGDHLLSTEDLERMQNSTLEMMIASYEHSEPERYGVIEEDDTHHLMRIIEKPKQPISNHVNVGLYTLSHDIFPVVQDLSTSERNEYEITDAINELAKTKPVRVVPLQGYWLDLGKPEDIYSLEQFLAAGNNPNSVRDTHNA